MIPIALFAFYPLMIFMSGSLNNDQLAMMFSIICLYYLLKWREDPSIKNTVLGALSIGLGLMTKESVLVMLIPAVYVFFKVLYEYVENDKKIGKLIIDLILLTIIVVPLGFWFHIYMNGESLGVIQPFEHLSVKEKTIFERFGPFNPFIYNGVNIWNALIFTSINYSVGANSLVSIIIVVIDMVLIINWIYYFIKSKKDSLLVVTSVAWWFGYFYLNITMPYISSMNARYMVIPLMIGIIDIAKGFEKEENNKIKTLTIVNTVALCICSIVYFVIL
jgi:4-amino-4-deoxy-L-arabinose transferase-like glycosyltransferase